MANKKRPTNEEKSSSIKESQEKSVEVKESPVLTAYSIVKREGGWSVAKYFMQDNKVLNVEYSVPEIKMITLEIFKMKFANEVIEER